MEERPPIWRAAVNKLNKQLRTAEEGWSSSLGVGRGANKMHVQNYPFGYGQVAGTCGYGEELSGSINAGNFLTSCIVYC
jgi:hypothetical protein